MFKNLWRRKPSLPTAEPYPLSLALAQVAALRAWHNSAGYEAWQHVIEELGRQRLARLVGADAAHAEFERGALSALHTIHDVVGTLLTKCEDIDNDRAKRRNGGDRPKSIARFLGSPFWDWSKR